MRPPVWSGSIPMPCGGCGGSGGSPHRSSTSSKSPRREPPARVMAARLQQLLARGVGDLCPAPARRPLRPGRAGGGSQSASRRGGGGRGRGGGGAGGGGVGEGGRGGGGGPPRHPRPCLRGSGGARVGRKPAAPRRPSPSPRSRAPRSERGAFPAGKRTKRFHEASPSVEACDASHPLLPPTHPRPGRLSSNVSSAQAIEHRS